MAVSAPTATAEPAWRLAAVFVVMMAAQSVAGMIFAAPPPILPMLAQEYGANGPWVARMVLSLSSFGLMLGALVSGWVVERGGVRRTIIGALVVYGLLGSSVIVIHSAWLLLGSRFLLGVVASFVTTACTVLLMNTFQGEARARFVGFQTGFGSIASVVIIAASGGLAQTFGWRAPFSIYGVFALIVVALALVSVPQTPVEAAAPKPAGSDGLLGLWLLFLVAAALFVIPIGLGGEMPFLLKDEGVTTPVVQSAVIGATTAFTTIASFAYGWIRAAIGARWTLAIGLLTMASGLLIVGLTRGALPAGAGTSLVGIGMGLFIPQLWARTAELAPEAVRPRALGFLNSAMFFGGFCNPFVFKPLHSLFGVTGAFTALGVMVAAGALAVIALRPKSLVAN
jgi:MFS family permease